MASEGPNSPETMADDASVGTDKWVSVDAAKVSDNIYTYAIVGPEAPLSSHYLKATFGFAIPADAVVDGILVEVEKKEANIIWNIFDFAVRIVKGGVIGATDKSSAVEWPTVEAYIPYGGAADLWGEVWTPADINSANFGFVIAAYQPDYIEGTPYVDHIRITVYYTLSSGTRGKSANMASKMVSAGVI